MQCLPRAARIIRQTWELFTYEFEELSIKCGLVGDPARTYIAIKISLFLLPEAAAEDALENIGKMVKGKNACSDTE